jgi:hypothetical protein
MSRNLLRTGLATALLAATVSAAGTAGAGSDSRQTAKLEFTQEHPGKSSGVTLRINYVNPDDPEGKPPAVSQVVSKLAKGAEFDTAAPEQCTASDAELMAQGEDACPDGSRVGGGVITIDTGFPEPNRFIVADTSFFNNAGELIFLSQDRETGGRVVSRSVVQERRIISEVPPLPGTPPDGGAIDRVHVDLDRVTSRRDGESRRYITTPESCPELQERWINMARFTYSDGVTQRVGSRSACL